MNDGHTNFSIWNPYDANFPTNENELPLALVLSKRALQHFLPRAARAIGRRVRIGLRRLVARHLLSLLLAHDLFELLFLHEKPMKALDQRNA